MNVCKHENGAGENRLHIRNNRTLGGAAAPNFFIEPYPLDIWIDCIFVKGVVLLPGDDLLEVVFIDCDYQISENGLSTRGSGF
jgi:hypothetical protein